MLILTAPSKTQQWIDRQFPTSTLPVFAKESSELIALLHPMSPERLCELMKMSSALAERTRQMIDSYHYPIDPEQTRQAIFTFQGDVYSALTPGSYSKEELLHAQNHIRILSGLYGILRPLDLMYPYRLEMGTRLVNHRGKTLYDFWSEKITLSLNRDSESHAEQTVINLASAEYTKVIRKKLLTPMLLTVVFKEKKGDTFKTVPIYAKRARSMMMHYIITQKLTHSEEIKSFTMGEYRFNSSLSDTRQWVFTRG